MNQTCWSLTLTDPSATTRFAAEEFSRLLSRMDPDTPVRILTEPADGALRIGLDAAADLPAVADPAVDDAIRISVRAGSGVITGTNPRSVLIAVYRFFREAGCVFLRPGRDGEYIPRRDSRSLCVEVCEAAAYRCRGICLEGSVSYENVAEMIDWAPKMGFNAYFTQLFRPVFAFSRWYNHASNPSLLPTPVSNETIDAFVADYSELAALRGLIHHRIGHGWASKLLGITSGAWHEHNDESEVRPDRRRFIAEIQGERRLYAGSAIDTNLCYSDPEVQKLLADSVVAYAKAHPDTTYLHFWLADQPNNQCECEACRNQRPADLYVDMLNQIDEQLTAAGCDTKIVFLIYLDLLWEPVRARLKNPDRFVLMYAPIRRSYSVPMCRDQDHEEAPFVRNGFRLTTSAGGTVPYLKAWQKVFHGDSFIFDYAYMWDYLNDPGCWRSVQILAQDAEGLHSLGLNGMMSCQNQRVFMPNGLGMHVLGSTLWTGKAAFDTLVPAYYDAAYGADGDLCRAFMEKLSDSFVPEVLRGERPIRDEALVRQYQAIPDMIDAFLPVIRRNRETASGVQTRSWECLEFHAGLCRQLSLVLASAACGDIAAMDAAWAEVRQTVCDNELRFQREFDVFEFFNVWEGRTLPRFQKEA